MRIDAASGAITIVVPLDREDLEKVQSCVTTPDAKARLAEAAEMVRQAYRDRDRADVLEDEALALLTQAIEGAEG